MNEEENKKARAEQEEEEAAAREEELNEAASSQGLDEYGMDIGENDSNNKGDNKEKKRRRKNKDDDENKDKDKDKDKKGENGREKNPKDNNTDPKSSNPKGEGKQKLGSSDPGSNPKSGGNSGGTGKGSGGTGPGGGTGGPGAGGGTGGPGAGGGAGGKAPGGGAGSGVGGGASGAGGAATGGGAGMKFGGIPRGSKGSKGADGEAAEAGGETIAGGGAETGASTVASAGKGANEVANATADAINKAAEAKQKAEQVKKIAELVSNPVGLIVLIIIIIIIIVIGVLGFFMTMPQFIWNGLKSLATDFWINLKGYFVGMDTALVQKEDIIFVGQYLYDMGYDLVGMGFAESVKIAGQKDEDGNMVPTDSDHEKNEIVDIDAPYLRAYLIAENRTYLINNYTFNLKDYFHNFFGNADDWGTGLIDLDDTMLESLGMPKRITRGIGSFRVGDTSLGEALRGVKVIRSNNTMEIKRMNYSSGLMFWKFHKDITYYSLEGWAGRYGKPFELMLTLHVATMAPDLVNEFANNKDLDAKVHVKLKETDFEGKVYVDGKTISDLESEGSTDADGNFVSTYDKSTIDSLKKLENDNASTIKTSMPYISSVTNHWFRNVYFEGTDSVDGNGNTDIGIDDDADGLEDFNEKKGVKTQKTRKLSANDNVYTFGESQGEMEYGGDPISGVSGEITIRGKFADGAIQNKDGVRGVTNPTTKKLFNKKYYIYDGTVAKAKEIQKARAAGDNSKKETIKFTKESLQAFTILEESETLDAQFVYRDLKELVIELGYFEKEDFYEIEKQVLEWPVPDYAPAEWPERKVEKQVIEYGTAIACEATVADSLGTSVDDLRKLTQTDEKKDDPDDDDDLKSFFSSYTFIGDSYFVNLENSGILSDTDFFAKDGVGPQYWIDHISELGKNVSKVCIYFASDPQNYTAMRNLIDALKEKYEKSQIYVIETMHVGQNYPDADKYNARIDTYNSQVRNKIKTMSDVRMIDASLGLMANGYLANPDADGFNIQSGEHTKWVKNMIRAINNQSTLTKNKTDEKFVKDLLQNAKELAQSLKDDGYQYGTGDYIPAKADGSTDDNGNKKLDGAQFVSWALYKTGCTDTPDNGLSVGQDGDFVEYCDNKKWQRIDDINSVHAGDIVFTGQLDNDGMKASRVFICSGKGKRYDCGSQDRISLTGVYSSYTAQPFNEEIDSDFMCAYRITGDGVINTGFQADLDVIAMGNGKIVKILEPGNNLYTLTGISRKIDGTDANNSVDQVPGRQQTDEGLAIKLTDKALRGYTLVIFGFKPDGMSVGQTVLTGDVLGKTTNSDIFLVLIDRDKSAVENIEDYIKVPKKTKLTRANLEWDFFYWVPYESGAIGPAGVPSQKGAGACGTVSGPAEVAVGISQWTTTTLVGGCNNIKDLCKWLSEEEPSFCAPLKTFSTYSTQQILDSLPSLQAAWKQVNEEDTDRFLELQMRYFYEVEYMTWVKDFHLEWLLDKEMITQGTYASLMNFGPHLGWEKVIDSSMSDEQICKALLTKAVPINSTLGPLKPRWESQWVLAKDVLDGKFTDVEGWVRTEQPSKYDFGQNPGALGYITQRIYITANKEVYIADIKRKLVGGMYV